MKAIEKRYRHKKRGTEYRILDGAQTEGELPATSILLQLDGPDDMAEMVVYQDVESGAVYVRRKAEFFDGRFEEFDAEIHVVEMEVTIGDRELADVKVFHQKFDMLDFDRITHLHPRKLGERAKFHEEEAVIEFRKGLMACDMAQMVDALIDGVYVLKGTAAMMGISPECWDELWDDVQQANMRKVRGATARGNKVDVTKPPGWEGPKTAEILARYGYDPEEWRRQLPAVYEWDPTKFRDDPVHEEEQRRYRAGYSGIGGIK